MNSFTMNHLLTPKNRVFFLFFLLFSVFPFCPDVFSDEYENRYLPAPGKSLTATLFRKHADNVVYVTGVNVQPEKNEIGDFFVTEKKKEEEMTVGTGFIIHPAGYVLTNAHSVMRSVIPVVELRNGSQYEAEVISLQKNQDLALVKISAKETLSAVEFAGPEDAYAGDETMIIGAPHGLKYTLTRGIISATGRAALLQDVPGVTLRNLLQTDAAINPGTSGGPWFDMRGKVLGITVSKRSESDNIGFGISIHTLHQLLPEMLRAAVKFRFQIGFTPELEIREAEEGGAIRCLAASVEEHSPAAKAGLRAGDEIRAVDGKKVETPLEFYLNLLGKEPETKMSLEIRRDAENLTLEFLPEKAAEPDVPAVIRRRLKMRVSPLSPEKIKESDLRTPTGVTVTELDEAIYGKLESPPEVGDMLVSVNYQRPRNPEHLAKILENIPREHPMNLVFVNMKIKDGKKSYSRTDVRNLKVE